MSEQQEYQKCERRELYRDGRTVVRAEAEADAPEDQEEMLPVADVDDEEERALFADMRRRWYAGDWEYLTLTVTVEFDGAAIGADAVGRVEHGTIGDGTTADAWLFASESPLDQATGQAIGRAVRWAERYGTARMREDLGAARRWHEEAVRAAGNRASRPQPGAGGRQRAREVEP